MADVDAALVQQILDIPEREREPNIHHYRQADDLGARLELTKRAWCVHPRTLRPAGHKLKRVFSDTARQHLENVRNRAKSCCICHIQPVVV